MSGLEEKGFGFGREAICSTGKRRKKEIKKKKKKKFCFNVIYLIC